MKQSALFCHFCLNQEILHRLSGYWPPRPCWNYSLATLTILVFYSSEQRISQRSDLCSMCCMAPKPTPSSQRQPENTWTVLDTAHSSAEEHAILFIYSHFKLPGATNKSVHFQEWMRWWGHPETIEAVSSLLMKVTHPQTDAGKIARHRLQLNANIAEWTPWCLCREESFLQQDSDHQSIKEHQPVLKTHQISPHQAVSSTIPQCSSSSIGIGLSLHYHAGWKTAS